MRRGLWHCPKGSMKLSNASRVAIDEHTKGNVSVDYSIRRAFPKFADNLLQQRTN